MTLQLRIAIAGYYSHVRIGTPLSLRVGCITTAVGFVGQDVLAEAAILTRDRRNPSKSCHYRHNALLTSYDYRSPVRTRFMPSWQENAVGA